MSSQESLRESVIGARLEDLASQVEVASPDWEDVRSGVVRIRRRRRAKRVGKVAGGLLATVALAGSLQVGWLPYPSWAPAASLSMSTGGTRLADRPTQGSLAGDDAWLDDFRRHVVSSHRQESRGEDWRVPTPGAVDVVYAGDVGSTRLVLVEAPYRWGVVEQRQQVWFHGPAGTDAVGMSQFNSDPPGDASFTSFGGVSALELEPGPLGLVMLATGDRRVTVEGWGVLEADGSVTRARTALTTGADGLLEWTAPAEGPYDVEVEGLGPQGLGEVVAQVSTVTWSGRGVRSDDEVVRTGVREAVFGLSLVSAPAKELWASSQAPGSPVLVSVQAQSGARLLVMGRVATPIPWRTGEHEEPSSMRNDVVRVLPADGGLLAAWQVGSTRWNDEENFDVGYSDADEQWYAHEEASMTIAFVGPEVAAVAEVVDAEGAVLRTVQLVDGGGSAEVEGAARVRFLAADGADLDSTDVVAWAAENSRVQPSP